MPRLDISLLGTLQVTRDDRPITEPVYGKVLALLAYLAVESDRPHQRAAISALLWPDHSEDRARHNLRQALTTLRRVVGTDDGEPCIVVQRDTLAFNPAAGHRVDVLTMHALLSGRAAHAHPDAARCVPCTRRLEDAVSLYRGEFLQGFSVPESDQFESWALGWRQRLQDQAIGALGDLAASHEAQGNSEGAISAVRRQLEIDPLLEQAHRRLMTLLWRSGNRTGALAHYARCQAILEEELGVEPEPETIALFEEIRAGDALPSRSPGRADGSFVRLPSPPTRMVGREADIDRVTDLLAQEDCRLLTITGPGGSGKTRLAIAVASGLARGLAEVTCFVPLAAARDEEGMASAIAGELGVTLRGREPVERQLIGWMREKSILLVLDSVEHLVDRMQLVPAMLSAVPHLKILATSRERLNVPGEWVHTIGGLAVPHEVHADGFEGYDAVELFTERLRQVRSGAPLHHDERPDVIRICQLVDGMPLGLELAAAWARTLRLPEIVTGIRQSLDFLSGPGRDRPDRHQSMRAVFRSSWELLTPHEQEAWCNLAVFEDGFTLDAAEQAGGTTLQSLAALVDKSLLTRLPSGRYRMHALLAQFGLEQLRARAPGPAPVEARHSSYYLGMLTDREEMLMGRDQPEALREIGDDIANIRSAWSRAIEHGAYHELIAAAPSYWLYMVIHGQMREGASAFGAWAEAMRCAWSASSKDVPKDVLSCGIVQAYTGGFLSGLGRYDEAIGLLTAGMELLREGIAGRLPGLALNMLAAALTMKGRYVEARSCLEESLEEFGRIRDSWGQAFSFNDLGIMLHRHFDDVAGERLCERSRGIFLQVGDSRGQAFAADNLGAIALARGDERRAILLHHEALALREEFDDQWGVAVSLVRLGRVLARTGDVDQAREHLQRALGVAWECSFVPIVLEGLTELAALDIAAGEDIRARDALTAIARHPSLPGELAQRVGELLSGLGAGSALPPEPIAEDRWAIRMVNEHSRMAITGDRIQGS